MKIYLLSIICAITLTFALPANVYASSAPELEEFEPSTSITVSGSVLHVVGASGMMLQVYNVTGVRVMNVRVDGADWKCTLNFPKGCYIVKVGKTVRKISIR